MLLFKKIISLPSLFLLSTTLLAQVEIDNSILLEGTSNTDKQVTNIANPTNINNTLNVENLQTNYTNFGTAISNGDTINVNLPIPPIAYSKGMKILFISPLTSLNQAYYIKIDSLPIVELQKSDTNLLNPYDLILGQVIMAVYNGNSFQLINASNTSNCPQGFTAVNENYCIETNENATSDFWSAIADCKSKNAGLCSWGQWYYACQKTGLGLANMTDNYEWTKDGANENYQVRIVGSGNCEQRSAGDVSTPPAFDYNYRCCYARK